MNRIMSYAHALLALTMLGCQPKAPVSTAVEETATLGPQFSANRGLFVPEDTRQSLGLSIVDVTEQEVTTTLDILFRVYQVSTNANLLSGMLAPDQAVALKVDQPVVIEDTAGGRMTGKITMLDGRLQKATGMIEVLAAIPGSSTQLTVGAFLSSTVSLELNGKVLTIPRSALLQCSDGYSVYTVSGEHLVRTPVKIGIVNAELVEIRDGLYTGDQVVSEPAMSLWMTELAAVKGGQACCVAPPKR